MPLLGGVLTLLVWTVLGSAVAHWPAPSALRGPLLGGFAFPTIWEGLQMAVLALLTACACAVIRYLGRVPDP